MPDVTPAREFLDAIIAAFAVLGGTMAYSSGLSAVRAGAQDARPDVLDHAINVGVAEGFIHGVPLSAVALIIALWN